MVDYYGNWIYDECVTPSKMCDMDYVALLVRQSDYEPVTTMENIVSMIILMYDGELKDNGREYFEIEDDREFPENLMINIDDVAAYVEATGGFSEFDYYA